MEKGVLPKNTRVEIDQEQKRNQLLDRIHIAYNKNIFKMDILSSNEEA
jgi:hypothetical protein